TMGKELDTASAERYGERAGQTDRRSPEGFALCRTRIAKVTTQKNAIRHTSRDGRFPQAGGPDVANHADDFCPWPRRAQVSVLDTFPDGVVARPVQPGHRLIDDDNRRPRSVVVLRDVETSPQSR